MKVFRSECPPDYNTYTFSYAEYATLETGDALSIPYTEGFLPYTGDVDIVDEIFYRCRSVRVNLSVYNSSSENKRVNRKAIEKNWTMRHLEKPEWNDMPDPLKEMALSYAKVRFSAGEMTIERLQYVYNRKAATDIFTFEENGKTIGFVLAGIDSPSIHYWFSFFDWDRMDKIPIGKWMMWKVIDWAKTNGHQFVYLGTCYGTKSLYKVRDFKGVEFHDGNDWIAEVGVLKQLCKWDSRLSGVDLYKYHRMQTKNTDT
jgi:arginine-tRNA-protein transferase